MFLQLIIKQEKQQNVEEAVTSRCFKDALRIISLVIRYFPVKALIKQQLSSFTTDNYMLHKG